MRLRYTGMRTAMLHRSDSACMVFMKLAIQLARLCSEVAGERVVRHWFVGTHSGSLVRGRDRQSQCLCGRIKGVELLFLHAKLSGNESLHPVHDPHFTCP